MAGQRSIWKGAITFGMLSIPVKLFGATSDQDVAFHLLHRESCRSRIKQKRWCPVHDREVFQDDLMRAYEATKDVYIEVTDEDLSSLPLPTLNTIEITEFVKGSEVDRVYAEKSYWLEPDQIGAKPYLLLQRAMAEQDVVGIGKLAIRQKERIVCVRPHSQGVLIVETLFWPDEVRSLGTAPDVAISNAELAMAHQLVEAFTRTFDVNAYRDDYRIKLLELIETKRVGGALPAPAEAPAPAPNADLMAMLKASIDQAKQKRTDAA